MQNSSPHLIQKYTEKDGLFFLRFGENVARFRREKNMSQVQLGQEMGTDKANVRKIEAGRANVTMLTLLKISNALDIPAKDLLNFDGQLISLSSGSL